MFSIKKLIWIIIGLMAVIVLMIQAVGYLLAWGNEDIYNELVRSGKVKDGKYVGDKKELFVSEEYDFEYSYPVHYFVTKTIRDHEELENVFGIEAVDHTEALLIWCDRDSTYIGLPLDSFVADYGQHYEKVFVDIGKETEVVKLIEKDNIEGRAIVHLFYIFIHDDVFFLFNYICLKQNYEKNTAIGEKMLSRLKLKDTL